jgi:hypothetical protein
MDAVETLVRQHRNWVEANASRIEARDLRYLKQRLIDGSVNSMLSVADSLNGLAIVYGSRGVADLLESERDGAAGIMRAIEYRAAELTVRAGMFFRLSVPQVNLTNYAARAACLVCCSDRWAGEAEEILRRAEASPGAIDEKYWRIRRFEPFVLACRDRTSGVTSPRHLEEPYGSVLRAWDDTAELASALVRVCEYHVKNMQDRGQAWDPEFKHVPFDILPCEVLLVRKCRQALDLPMPQVDHELVQHYDAKLADTPAFAGDEILREVAEALSRVLG